MWTSLNPPGTAAGPAYDPGDGGPGVALPASSSAPSPITHRGPPRTHHHRGPGTLADPGNDRIGSASTNQQVIAAPGGGACSFSAGGDFACSGTVAVFPGTHQSVATGVTLPPMHFQKDQRRFGRSQYGHYDRGHYDHDHDGGDRRRGDDHRS